jgi:hypothetical protein
MWGRHLHQEREKEYEAASKIEEEREREIDRERGKGPKGIESDADKALPCRCPVLLAIGLVVASVRP